jgi:hypothetical protein
MDDNLSKRDYVTTQLLNTLREGYIHCTLRPNSNSCHCVSINGTMLICCKRNYRTCILCDNYINKTDRTFILKENLLCYSCFLDGIQWLTIKLHSLIGCIIVKDIVITIVKYYHRILSLSDVFVLNHVSFVSNLKPCDSYEIQMQLLYNDMRNFPRLQCPSYFSHFKNWSCVWYFDDSDYTWILKKITNKESTYFTISSHFENDYNICVNEIMVFENIKEGLRYLHENMNDIVQIHKNSMIH